MFDIAKPVDRTVVIVRPRQPFIDWLNGLPGHRSQEFSREYFREDCTALLVPEFEDETELDEYLDTLMERIFRYELESWVTDPALWPADRSVKTAREWLEFEMHSEVYDTTRRPPRAGRGK